MSHVDANNVQQLVSSSSDSRHTKRVQLGWWGRRADTQKPQQLSDREALLNQHQKRLRVVMCLLLIMLR